MRIARLWTNGCFHEIGEQAAEAPCRELLHAALHASERHAIDPMDAAIHDIAQRAGIVLPEGPPLRTDPLRPDFLAFVQVWPDTDGSFHAAKGAPETIARLCELGDGEKEAVEAATSMLADRGLRTLAVASARSCTAEGTARSGFRLLGLIGFLDPVRPEVPAAIAEAKRAGIKVAMITGDYPATAIEIARQAGIDTSAGWLTGREIAALGAEALADRIGSVRVFARVAPEQKLALVEAFKARSEIVAMTGDGVNDAPALMSAHIGVAMGLRGTAVAREAADLVLLDDSFASIVGGIRLGRRIFTNLRRALTFITAVHVPTAGLALLPVLLGLPPILYPMHIVLLELLIDPLSSLTFESEPSEQRAMSKPPRPASEPLFGRLQLASGLLQGIVILIAVFSLYWTLHARGHAAEIGRATAFVALVAANLSLALCNASSLGSSLFDWRRRAFWAIGGGASLILIATLAIPSVSALLQFRVPSATEALVALGIGILAGSLPLLLYRYSSRR